MLAYQSCSHAQFYHGFCAACPFRDIATIGTFYHVAAEMASSTILTARCLADSSQVK